jgi:gliding motility-associated-like protein
MSLFKKQIPNEKLTYSETPLLKEAGKNNPFQVPENYFENFEQQIMQQVKFVKPVSPVEHLFRKISSSILQPQIAVAASVVLILATSALLYLNHFSSEETLFSENFDIEQNTLIKVNNNLPSDKLFKATIENSSKGSPSLTIEISPDATLPELKIIAKTLPVRDQSIAKIENKVSQYFAVLNQAETSSQHIVKETSVAKLNSSTPHTVGSTQNLQPIYQYHPHYSGITPQLPYHTTSLLVNDSLPALQPIKPENIIQKPNQVQVSGKLPHFALPETVCSESVYELKPNVINNNLKYVWSTGEQTPAIVVRSSGTYTLTIYDPESPKEFVSSSTHVRIIPKPEKSLPTREILCSGNTLKLEPKIENPELYNYFWIPTYETEKNITINEQGLYVLSITGCSTYFDSVLVTREHCDIMIPNVITPNNDGINDYFYIQGLEKYPNTHLTIYDRSGNMILSSNDYQNNWTGDKHPNGTYFFILRFYDGIEKHGTLTILK